MVGLNQVNILRVARSNLVTRPLFSYPIIGKHIDKFPCTLFAIQKSKIPKLQLRERAEQQAKNLTNYDFVAVDGNILPLVNDTYIQPNGMSLRPNTLQEWNLIADRGGKVYVAEIGEGTPIPEGMVLIHEFEDHFSLQPAKVMPVEDFNHRVSSFLRTMKVYTRAEWLAVHPLGTQTRM
jgi:hypothetical protein